MKIKLDENLPFRLVRILAQFGHDADTVAQEGLAGQDDPHVWEAAQRAVNPLGGQVYNVWIFDATRSNQKCGE